MPQHDSIIYVDTREDQRPHPFKPDKMVGTDMLDLVRKHRDHPKAAPKFLAAGDFYFAGNGPKGPALFGIERKRTKDMLSSIRYGRFAGEQIPKLFNHYEFVFLIIESRAKTNWQTGILEESYGRETSPVTFGNGRQTFLGLELMSWMNSISVNTPIRIIRTRDERETVEWVVALNHTFSKQWDDHSAHVAIHQPQEFAMVGKASTVRRMAHTLEGVGWDRSGKIEHHPGIGSVADFICRDSIKCENEGRFKTKEDWSKIPGICKVLADRIWKQLHGQYDPDVLE
jgi:ERCC4-type nuclease